MNTGSWKGTLGGRWSVGQGGKADEVRANLLLASRVLCRVHRLVSRGWPLCRQAGRRTSRRNTNGSSTGTQPQARARGYSLRSVAATRRAPRAQHELKTPQGKPHCPQAGPKATLSSTSVFTTKTAGLVRLHGLVLWCRQLRPQPTQGSEASRLETRSMGGRRFTQRLINASTSATPPVVRHHGRGQVVLRHVQCVAAMPTQSKPLVVRWCAFSAAARN